MTDLRHALHRVDAVAAPDLWPDASGRQPGRPPPAPARVRVLIAVLALAVAAAGIGIGVAALAGRSPNRTIPAISPAPTGSQAQTGARLGIGDTDMPPGFVPQTVVSSSPSKLVLEAPPGRIRWTLNGLSCDVDYTWLVIPKGGSPGGGGGGGAACPWAPHLSVGAGGSYGSNGALFSVVGGHVLPATGVRVRVRLANGAETTVEPQDSMWLVVVQRCGDYVGTEITSVELLGGDGSVIDKKDLEPETVPSPNPWPTWPPC